MLDKIKSAVSDYEMLKCGETVVCALSGGADSVALTLSLLELGYDVSCVHVNHNLRGKESDSDEIFCTEFCKRLNIGLKVFSVDVNSLCKEKSISCEEAARILRYDCILKHADKLKVATAHTANDNLETVLINLTRGTGLKGACGIPPKRGNVIRPLIYAGREDIEGYLQKKGFDFVTDSTNLSDDYTRNKIRHNVVPILKEINPNILKNTLGLKKTLELENSFIEENVNSAFEQCFDGKNTISNLHCYHKAIRHRLIMKFLNLQNINCNFERVCEIDNMLMSNGDKRLTVSIDFEIITRDGAVFLHKKLQEFNDFKIKLQIGKNTFFQGRIVEATISDNVEDFKINTLLAKDYIDYDKIKGQPFLRCRRRGDKIKLHSRDFTSSVKTLLNANIRREKRDTLCFLEDDEGLIFVEGIGVADRVKVDSDTERILKIIAYN